VRPTFGSWAASVIDTFPENDLYLVPVPDTEALSNVKTYRTLKMVQEAFKQTALDGCALDGLRWTKRRQKAHEGGSRKRKALSALLEAKPEVKGKNIVLIDEIVTTGGNLLACQDKLAAAGATVVGAVTCGLSVYDVKETPPFSPRNFDLTEQLQDYSAAS
jgi:predicted amidophosphoribosyltransferase